MEDQGLLFIACLRSLVLYVFTVFTLASCEPELALQQRVGQPLTKFHELQQSQGVFPRHRHRHRLPFAVTVKI